MFFRNFNIVFIVFFLFLIPVHILGQEESEEACKAPSKKTIKYIKKAKKEKDFKKKMNIFQKALKPEESTSYILIEYAKEVEIESDRLIRSSSNPQVGLKFKRKSIPIYLNAHSSCPLYSSEPSYKLALFYLENEKRSKAIKWMKFHTENKSNFINKSADYDYQYRNFIVLIGNLEEEVQLYENEVPFNPSIVKNVSSSNNEYFPMLSPDNLLMFYTRKSDKKNIGDIVSNIVEEFTFSIRSNNQSLFNKGDAFGPPFNQGDFSNYGAATMSIDNKEMIICACKEQNVNGQDYLNCDLYSTTYERTGEGGNDFKWGKLINLGKNINTNDGWEGQPCLSADGQTLFFTSSRANSRDNDIYIVNREPNGDWGKAKPFDEINTAGKDKSPFFHQDGETLYFVSTSSNYRKGMGGLDIFYIRKIKDGWTKPKNIGYPINSKRDEIGLFVSTSGKRAYYSSKKQGDWNIYQFDLYEEARPKEVVIITGALNDENGEPLVDASLELTYLESGETSKVRINGNDGKFAAAVKVSENQDVLLTVNKEGYTFDNEVISLDELINGEKKINNNLEIKEIKKDQLQVIDNIVFESRSFDLTKNSKIVLNGFSKFLKNNPTLEVEIQGHTDDIGDAEDNLELSKQRSLAVKEYLLSEGIDEGRVKAKGYGETLPKFKNNSSKNRAKNRRTEFLILNDE